MITPRKQLKLQQEADPDWSQRVKKLPGCERLFYCMQCGTCSGTCPLSIYMDYTPRRILNLVREGFRDDALRSQTIWLCASCYSCVALCPQDINITDVMYSLKREAIRHRLYPSHFPIPVLAREFFNMVWRRGRNAEFWVVFRMAMRSNPLILLGMLRTGWELLRTGRIALRREKIVRVEELRRALTSSREAH